MGTPPSAPGGWNNSGGERGEREAVETVMADVRVSMIFSATMNESGQVPDEEVMELAFAVGNH